MTTAQVTDRERLSSPLAQCLIVLYTAAMLGVVFLDVFLSTNWLQGKLFPFTTTFSFLFISVLFWKEARKPAWPCSVLTLMASLTLPLVFSNIVYVLFWAH